MDFCPVNKLCLYVLSLFNLILLMKICFFYAFIAMITLSASAAAQTRLTPELLWSLGRVNLSCISPDNRIAYYTVQSYDLQTEKSNYTVYAVDINSGATRQIIGPADRISNLQIRPDGGRIGLLYNGQMHEMDPNGGNLKKVTDLEMKGFKYAPDGSKILYLADVKLELSPAEAYPDLKNAQARLIDGLFYRHWNAWHDYKYGHVFYANYRDGELYGMPTDIMIGQRYNAPLEPFGGIEQVCWTPNSRGIVYTARKLNGTKEALSTNSDIYYYDLATGQEVNISADLPGYDQDPLFSPDGKYLIWSSMERPGYEADRTRIMLLDVETNQRSELTAGWRYEAKGFKWAADSRSVYFLSATDFTYQICQIGLAERRVRIITQGQHDYKSLLVAGAQLVAQRESMDQPAEIYAVNPLNGEARKITQVNDLLWNLVSKGKVERASVRTSDGKDMNVWLIFPPNFDPTRKYPTLLYCQGGPQSALSQFFSYRWNFQLMAANDYVVVAPCRRGMPGSGQEWNDAIMRDWGGRPMQDLLDAADFAARQPWCNSGRMGAVGASYGGYSVYWLAGNHQGRFKAFISHCGLFNLESFYGTTEELFFANNDLGGPYWENPAADTWRRHSPHHYVANWDTPILVIHNERDYRVPLSEGMQAFQAAQLKGIPSRFLYFENEGHHVLKPHNSILWQRVFFGWLDEYLKK